MTTGLFSDDRFAARGSRTGRALVPVGPECPDCGGDLATVRVEQPAMFVHGGHGADKRSTWAVCLNGECRWSLCRAVEETRPLYRPARLR